MLLPLALLASLALAPQAVPAQTPSAAETPAQASDASATDPATLAPADDPQPQVETERVCRTEAVTGSRFGRQVCRGGAQAHEDRVQARQMLHTLQRARMPDGG